MSFIYPWFPHRHACSVETNLTIRTVGRFGKRGFARVQGRGVPRDGCRGTDAPPTLTVTRSNTLPDAGMKQFPSVWSSMGR